MADISALSLTETTEFTLKHPSTGFEIIGADDVNPITFTIYGKTSKAWKKIMEAYRKKAMNPPKRPPTTDELRQDNIDYYCTMTSSIDNMSHNGELVNTPDAVRALYADESLGWIGEAVQAELGEVGSFLKA